jgi:hypothetical protein
MNQARRADTGLDRLPGELVDWLAKPFASFLRIEAAGGAILLVVTIAALVLSNSPWADQFLTFWELPVGIRIGSLEAARSLRDWINDALMTLFFFVVHATRAAVEEGIVPGGGVTLLYAAKALEKLKPENDDQRVGMDIVRKALAVPARQIVINAGADGSIVVGKLLDKDDLEWGYDAQDDKFVNMFKAGIVDPAKVVRTALQDAASVAGLIITTEAMIAERPKKESTGGGMPGGMGGMGGMGDMDY